MLPSPRSELSSQAELNQRLSTYQVGSSGGSLGRLDMERGKERSSSLQRSGMHNATSTRENARYRGKSDELPLMLPPCLPPSKPPPLTPRENFSRRDVGSQRPLATPSSSPMPRSGEQSSKTRIPPKRPPRPSSELFLPPPPPSTILRGPSLLSFASMRSTGTPAPPPSISEKSSLRQVPSVKQPEPQTPLKVLPLVSGSTRSSTRSDPRISVLSQASSTTSLPGLKSSPQRSVLIVDESPISSTIRSTRDRRARDGSPSSTASKSAPATVFEFPIHPIVRSSTAPPSLRIRPGSIRSVASSSPGARSPRSPRSPTYTSRHAKKGSVSSLDTHLRNTEKTPSSQRATRTASVRAVFLDGDDISRKKREADAIMKSARSTTPSYGQTRGRRKRKGETMSMLLDTGFFPVSEIIYVKDLKPSKMRTSAMYRINLPPKLSFSSDKDLPPTPESMETPTELWYGSPTAARRRSKRKSSGAGRRPLLQISEGDANVVLSTGGLKRESDQLLANLGLAAIPEDGALGERTPPGSAAATPVATEILLRGGSIVTVTPAELDAWKPTAYVHGPIKLPKPSIVPRKNSVASLEPFQDMIDHVYQQTLAIPRRRSDDAVADDICDFFDCFGFDIGRFKGDRLSIVVVEMEDTGEMDAETERFSTPPLEAVNEVVTKSYTKPTPWLMPATIPPLETEETLRARGIARLSRGSVGSIPTACFSDRKESLALINPQNETTNLPLLPPPEESMLDAVLYPGRASMASSVGYRPSLHHSHQDAGDPGFELDDGVEELDADSTWVAPAVAPQRPGAGKSSHRKTKNPLTKLRRAVAMASATI